MLMEDIPRGKDRIGGGVIIGEENGIVDVCDVSLNNGKNDGSGIDGMTTEGERLPVDG